jgi:hypothetical protein
MNDWMPFVRYVAPIAFILALVLRRFLTPKPHTTLLNERPKDPVEPVEWTHHDKKPDRG